MRTSHRGRWWTLTALVAALALSFSASATAAPPELGALTAMSGTSGCQMVVGGSLSCTPAAGIAQSEASVVSPDGRNVYVTSFSSTAPSAPTGLAAFSRDPLTGALTQLPGTSGCVTASGNSAAGAGTCTAVPAFGSGGDDANLAVTPDGRFVYVVSSNIIIIFSRDPATGALTQPSGRAGCVTPTGSGLCQAAPDLADPQDVSISPDGRSLYVSELAPDGILVLSRDASTGALSEVQCLFDAPAPTGCDTGRNVGFSEPVVISPDGLHAFSSEMSTGISSLNRDPVTGRLTQSAGAAGCISDDATDGHGGVCAQGRFLNDPVSMAISPDGRMLYATSNPGGGTSGVAFVHIATDGSLSQPAGVPACISNTGHDQGTGSCEVGRGLEFTLGVTVSPDGRTLYATDNNGDGGDGIDTFSIVPADGSLSQLPAAAGCTTVDGSSGGVPGQCGTGGPGLSGPVQGAVSPDGTNLYLPTSTNDALIGFHRATAPVCQPATASTPFQTSVRITVSCSDADGDPISVSVASNPAHGTVGTVDPTAHSVLYTPAAGYSGPDSFMFTASDGTNSSGPQTAAITVGARPPVIVPRLSRVGQSHKRWRERGTARKHAPPVGTTFRFTLNVAARVTLTFTQRLPGRRAGGRCVAPSRRNAKHPACSRTKRRGSVSFAAVKGVNRLAFSGTIPHHGRLAPGNYSVALTAVAQHLHSTSKTLRFTIVG